MENLSFLLKLTLSLRCALECGEPIRPFLHRFLSQEHAPDALKFKTWLTYYERTKENKTFFKRNIFNMLCELMAQGLEGMSVLDRIKSFEEELIEVCKEDLQKKLDQLPYEMMVPLLLFMFPGYLLLILGPVVVNLLESF